MGTGELSHSSAARSCFALPSRAYAYALLSDFRFLPSLLHPPIQHANTQNITSEDFTFFCLHLPSPVLYLYPTPSVKAFRGETFTLIILYFKSLRHKGEEVKAKIEKQWMRA